MITCPSCNHQNEAGSAFCYNCGYDLSNAGPAMPQAGGGAICSNCNFSNIPGAAFCEQCGTPLAQNVPAPTPGPGQTPAAGGPVCSNCQMENVPGASFCENCGTPLGQPVPATPPAKPQPVATPPKPAAPQGAAAGERCSSCGFVNPPGTKFCESCGLQMGQAPVAPRVTHISGHLVIQASGDTLPIPAGKTEILIGREDPVSNIFPEIDLDPHGGHDGGVGRKHARLFMQAGQLMLEDLDSVNGTLLNKQKVDPGKPQPVTDGAEIRFGKLVVIYHAA